MGLIGSFLARLSIAMLAVFAAGRIEAASVYESEPNDTPATANPVAGAGRIAGVQVSTEQDGFMWTVSDEDARKRWTLELQGIADAVTVVDVFTVEFADNAAETDSSKELSTDTYALPMKNLSPSDAYSHGAKNPLL